mmetsp:Transcript_856/g.1181  ORF Transcript_856/g.1181 Transcript_856/m.1181 type:complete len:123 (+) Transcript_856:1000-1368(+)
MQSIACDRVVTRLLAKFYWVLNCSLFVMKMTLLSSARRIDERMKAPMKKIDAKTSSMMDAMTSCEEDAQLAIDLGTAAGYSLRRDILQPDDESMPAVHNSGIRVMRPADFSYPVKAELIQNP